MAVAQKSRGWANVDERALSAPTLAFDLEAELAALRKEPEWKAKGQNARTLAKYPDTRIVLEVMRKGTRFSPNGPAERLTVQCLSGRVRVHHPDRRTTDVRAGGLCTVDRFMVTEVEAMADSSCLLTVSWPPGA
jgi:hypothetical protein